MRRMICHPVRVWSAMLLVVCCFSVRAGGLSQTYVYGVHLTALEDKIVLSDGLSLDADLLAMIRCW